MLRSLRAGVGCGDAPIPPRVQHRGCSNSSPFSSPGMLQFLPVFSPRILRSCLVGVGSRDAPIPSVFRSGDAPISVPVMDLGMLQFVPVFSPRLLRSSLVGVRPGDAPIPSCSDPGMLQSPRVRPLDAPVLPCRCWTRGCSNSPPCSAPGMLQFLPVFGPGPPLSPRMVPGTAEGAHPGNNTHGVQAEESLKRGDFQKALGERGERGFLSAARV